MKRLAILITVLLVCNAITYGMTMEFVSISEAGFTGQMAKYETTNAQYCEFLNDALASGDITSGAIGANGSNSGTDFVSQLYYDLAGEGYDFGGVTNGGAARINYAGDSFTVDSGFENHPVTYVSWYGATAFASYYGWSLPTESEWKVVADYDGSYIISQANYYDSIHPYGTTAVGSFKTDDYEMADMAGNVWEWTSSLWEPPQDGYRSMAGCSWTNLEQDLATVWKTGDYPYRTHGTLGFRVVPEPATLLLFGLGSFILRRK